MESEIDVSRHALVYMYTVFSPNLDKCEISKTSYIVERREYFLIGLLCILHVALRRHQEFPRDVGINRQE